MSTGFEIIPDKNWWVRNNPNETKIVGFAMSLVKKIVGFAISPDKKL